MLSQDSCGRRECGAMRFATRFAMAMSDRTIELRETIGNRAAETAALDHVHSYLSRGHDDSWSVASSGPAWVDIVSLERGEGSSHDVPKNPNRSVLGCPSRRPSRGHGHRSENGQCREQMHRLAQEMKDRAVKGRIAMAFVGQCDGSGNQSANPTRQSQSRSYSHLSSPYFKRQKICCRRHESSLSRAFLRNVGAEVG